MMARWLRVAAVAAAVVTALAGSTTARSCSFRDACDAKASISSWSGGYLTDSCRRTYTVSATCGLSRVRVCTFRDRCASRSLAVPSGGLLRDACGDTYVVTPSCRVVKQDYPAKCRTPRLPCAAFPISWYQSQVNDPGCGPAQVLGDRCTPHRVVACPVVDPCTKLSTKTYVGGVAIQCGKAVAVVRGCKLQPV